MGNKNDVSLLYKSVVLLLIILFLTSALTEPSISATTTVYVSPSSKTVTVGQIFFLYIKISDVTDLYGWEFKLKWNPNLLDVIDVTEGSFLRQGGDDTFFSRKINNTEGYILADCTLLGDVSGMNGSGTLAYVEFYAEKEGSSILDLYDTILINSLEQSIPHTADDGSVTVSKSVGGVIISVSKFELLAPWIGLTSTIILAMTAIVVFFRRRKKRNEPQK